MTERAFGGAVSMLLHHGTSMHGKGMIHAECSHGLADYCGVRKKPNCDERKIMLTFVPAGRAVLDLQKETMKDGQAERDEEGFGALECVMQSLDTVAADFEHCMDDGEPLHSRFCVVGVQDGVTKQMDMTMFFTYLSKMHPANREFKRLMGKKLSLELEWEYNDDSEMQVLLQKAVGQRFYNNCRVEWERLKASGFGGAHAMLATQNLTPPFALGMELKKNPNYKPSAEEKKNKKSMDPNHKQCAHCGGGGDSGSGLKKCSRCGNVFYCSVACQASDWKNGHKQFCKTKEERSVPIPSVVSNVGGGGAVDSGGGGGVTSSKEECTICKVSQDGTTKKLPCGHSFHRTCLMDLFSFGTTQTCPICRAPLPSKKQLENL